MLKGYGPHNWSVMQSHECRNSGRWTERKDSGSPSHPLCALPRELLTQVVGLLTSIHFLILWTDAGYLDHKEMEGLSRKEGIRKGES